MPCLYPFVIVDIPEYHSPGREKKWRHKGREVEGNYGFGELAVGEWTPASVVQKQRGVGRRDGTRQGERGKGWDARLSPAMLPDGPQPSRSRPFMVLKP